MMTLYEMTFVKKDGTERTIKYIRILDLPEQFLVMKMKGPVKNETRVLSKGLELVWDIENDGFRVINHNTMKKIGILNENYKLEGY